MKTYRLQPGCRIRHNNTLLGEIVAAGPKTYLPHHADGAPVRARNRSRLPGWPDERSAIAALLAVHELTRFDITTERIWRVFVHDERLGEVYRFQRDRTFFFAARAADGTKLTTSCGLPGWTDKDTAARALVGHHYPRTIRAAA